MSKARSEHVWKDATDWLWRVWWDTYEGTWVAGYGTLKRGPWTRAMECDECAAEIAKLKGLVPPGGAE